ncbi:unnamed protein product [Acanthoscelides obtectus]|uniref:Uncharacterized protein n=1 Tax=Acanthoscelides obtectus TaxID=200917 RepID=A0A9P0LLC3_ACAOB|nr:unnamed protein product [Acanthoscelides obtectus]CAK1657167.1 hypothetical protein AOBTE_LOCUS20171 [Acanthoscelides obtectus]
MIFHTVSISIRKWRENDGIIILWTDILNCHLDNQRKSPYPEQLGSTKKNVHEFFDILEKCFDENGLTAQQIYNVDETGFSSVQKRNQKIIARRGKHQVRGLETFIRSNPGNTVSQYNMTGLLSDAYAKTASISTIMNGFKRTGLWPVDRTVFSETDFIAANAVLENDSEKPSEPKDDATEPPVYSDSTEQNKHCNRTGLNTSIEEIYPLPLQSDKPDCCWDVNKSPRRKFRD